MAFMIQHMIVYNNGDEKHKMYKIFSPETTNRAATSNLQSLIAPQKNPHRMKSEEYRDCTGRPHRRPSSNAFCVCVCVPLLFQYIIHQASCACVCAWDFDRNMCTPHTTHPTLSYILAVGRDTHTEFRRLGCTAAPKRWACVCMRAYERTYMYCRGKLEDNSPSIDRVFRTKQRTQTDG